MTCRNKVSFYVPNGFDQRVVQLRCGNTDPFGKRVICNICANDPSEMSRIQQHERNMAADNAWLKSAGWGEM